MNIRTKVTALIACLFVVLGVAEILVEKGILLPSFAELERADARIAMRRIIYAFDKTLDRLAVSATDWGNWTDTYRFMEDHNQAYITDNVTQVALKQLNVNVMLLVDLDGKFVLSNELDLN